MSPRDRFLAKIERLSDSECWPWRGSIGTWGYGSFYLAGRNINASRATYLLLVGNIPSGMVVCHSCDNPACCNPSHLWLGTQGDNVRDCQRKGRGRGNFRGGVLHPNYSAKLTPAMVHEARRRFASGESQSKIAREWGVNSGTISRAVRGESWGHVS